MVGEPAQPCYLVCSGSCNKTPQTGWLMNNRNVSLTVLEAGSSRSGDPHGQILCLMRPCFPVNKCLSLAVTSRRGSTSFVRALISPSAGFLYWSLGWFRTEEVWSMASLFLSPPRSPPSSPPVLSSACLSSGSEGSVLMALSPPHLIITGPCEDSVSNFMSHPCVWVLSHFSCIWLFVTP